MRQPFLFLNDCQQFFKREESLLRNKMDPYILVSATVGVWVFLNIINREPDSKQDYALAQEIGMVIAQGLYNYWK